MAELHPKPQHGKTLESGLVPEATKAEGMTQPGSAWECDLSPHPHPKNLHSAVTSMTGHRLTCLTVCCSLRDI